MNSISGWHHGLSPDLTNKLQVVADFLGVSKNELIDFLDVQLIDNYSGLKVTEEVFEVVLGQNTKLLEQIFSENS